MANSLLVGKLLLCHVQAVRADMAILWFLILGRASPPMKAVQVHVSGLPGMEADTVSYMGFLTVITRDDCFTLIMG